MRSEKAMATHSSTLAWKIPWTEEPGRLQSMRSLRLGYNWVTSLSLFTFMHWRRKWQPTPVFLPGESQGRRSLVGCRLWGHTESDMTEWLSRKWGRRYLMLIKLSKIWEQANLHRHTAPISLLILFIIDLYYYIDKLIEFNYNHLTFFITKSHWVGWWFQNVVGPKSSKDTYIKKHELYFRNSIDWSLAWKFRWFLDLLRISKILFIDETEMKVAINLCNTKNDA